MGALQPWHIILIVIVFLVLFGSKKLPDAARGLGRSMRIFKSEMKEMHNEGSEPDTAQASEPQRQITPGSTPEATTSPAADADTQRKSA